MHEAWNADITYALLSPRIPGNGIHQIGKLEWLGKNHVESGFDCSRSILLAGVPGDGNQRDITQRGVGPHMAGKVQSVHFSGQSEIAEDNVGPDFFRGGQGCLGTVRDMRGAALNVKNVADELGKVLVVLDDQCNELFIFILHGEVGKAA